MCPRSHLFTWKLTCAWPSSCCSVLISLLCATQGDGRDNSKYSRMRQLDWSHCLALAELRWGVSAVSFAGFSAGVFTKPQLCVGPAGASICCRSGIFDLRSVLAWSPGSYTWCPLAGAAGPWGDRMRCWEKKSPRPVLGFWQKVNLFPTFSPCFGFLLK